jgi:adenylosuccinate synthase
VPATIVIGAQWGDEGKGRIIDLLAEEADYVVRFQGGSNAGHTLFDDQGQKIVLHQIPSGILRHDKCCVIGNGVVIDPLKLVDEITALQKAGYLKKTSQLLISDACHLVMPYHKLIDQYEEEARGVHKIGTTGKGIGPVYVDKVGRNGIRMVDLLDEKRFREKLKLVLQQKNLLITKLYNKPAISENDIINSYLDGAKQLAPYVKQVHYLLHQALHKNQKILFEGAQGSELDIDHGTYPFVTSSNTLAPAALLGSGVPLQAVERVIGIMKAYSTRVGSGPFPTEDKGEAGEQLCIKGHEFGSTTGRKRRCGWLDIPQLRHAIMLNGIDSLILTKLDILSGFEQVKIAAAYKFKGQRIDELPTSYEDLAQVEPIYEEFPGWELKAEVVHSLDELPRNARAYVKRIQTLLDCPIQMASIGPKRDNYLCHEATNFSAFSASPAGVL